MTGSQDLISLWNKYASGEEKAFDQIFKIYQPILSSYAMGLLKQLDLAENAVADTFSKVIQCPNKAEIEAPESWLFTITRNYCISYWRKRNRRYNILNSITPSLSNIAFSEAELNLDKSLITGLISKKLSQRDFAIWELAKAGYDNSEIAEALDISKKTVGNRKSMIKSDITKIYNVLESTTL